MKRILAFFLCMLLLLSGCAGKAPEPTPSAAPAPSEDTAPSRICYVSTVDELLNAIAPDTEIILQPGTYTLTDASNYGRGSSPYYTWAECYDGYELHITGVDGLTIRGSGMDSTTLETLPRYAYVLTTKNCTKLELADMTLGHVKAEPGECSGGVVLLDGCSDLAITNCGLFGCGTTGIHSIYTEDVMVTGTHIYQCSVSGVRMDNSQRFCFDGCQFYELGTPEQNVYAVFDLNACKNIQVTDSTLRNNCTYTMAYGSDCTNFNMTDCVLTGNSFLTAFSVPDSTMVFDRNRLDENIIRSWYADFSNTVTDESGKALEDKELSEAYASSMVTVPEASGETTEVHVSTVDEFLAAIADDTTIILDAELYDLSTASDYGKETTGKYTWVDNYDGPCLNITDVNNLTIRSNDGKMKNHTIAAIPRYADVLNFQRCSNITLSGFTAGHTKEPGSCCGGVLHFVQTDGITVENCGLFGCGILGIQAEYCSQIDVDSCEIYECSNGGVQMWDTTGIRFTRCIFRDLGGDRLYFNNCSDITEDGQILQNGSYN